MNESDPILIEPKRVSCPGHGEHLRASWPNGFAAFMMTIVEAMFASEEFMRECGWGPGKTADVGRINEILAQRPACYFVGRDILRKALMESGIGTIGLCLLCGLSGVGGPYSVDQVGQTVELNHVCFECALNAGERIHRAHPNGGVWHE